MTRTLSSYVYYIGNFSSMQKFEVHSRVVRVCIQRQWIATAEWS